MIPLEKKNLNPINWKPQGLCVAIATNNSFYVNDEHGRTRAMPIVFKKNFEEKNIIPKGEMINRLLSEKDEFIQWCVDYRQWMFERYPQLLNGEALLMCTDEDLEKLNGDYDAFSLFKNMCEKQKLGDRKFCNWNARTDEEEEIQSMANNTWETHLPNLIKDITMFSKGKKVFTIKALINRINRELEIDFNFDSHKREPHNADLANDIKLYFDTNFVSYASKDRCRMSIIKWLEENEEYDTSEMRNENYTINGKRMRGVVIVNEIEETLTPEELVAKMSI